MFFDTEKKISERTIQDCSAIVEAFFRKVNVDPARQRFQTKNGCGWTIRRGSATIYILLGEVNNVSTIRVVAPILYLPQENLLPFYRRCLELNFTTLTCAFAVNKDMLVVVSERPITGLDPNELENTMIQVGHVADTFDNKLGEEFGAKLITSP